MTKEELVKLLRAVHQLDIKEEQERLVTENATCIDPTRIRIGLLRGDWTSEEEKHFYTCSRCRGFRQKIQREIWHPTIRQLWSIAAQGYPEVRFAEATNLVEKHLENDRCGRCIFVRDIFDKVLRRTKPGT